MKKNDRKNPRNDRGREQKKESYHRADLKRRDTRRQDDDGDDSFVIVGKNPVMEALRSEQQMDKLLILKDNKDHVLGDIAEKARKRGIVVQSVEKMKLEGLADGQPHQGVAAMMAPFPYSGIEDVLAKADARGEEPLVVILDHLTDPHNLGAIIRSANLCGVHGVIIPKRRSASLTAVSVKASSGAVAHTPIVKVGNLTQCIDDLKAKGFWIMAADMDGAPYYKNDFKGKLAIIIGNEGKGISPNVKKQCDYSVSIPLYGDIDSFNASAAAAIILSEAARQRHQ
ncbi:23S rRNA (guanosine(2251)-2'-O)-methyltransferase RlmB [Eubacterium sp. 1001713B170207_170306_E7]|uniref:23S rRNA (guanosine(2251)-2'-O)-methyltransferase RlmB n=1 Tax=Eubacterium sp. 1001713B170207_170306_E7 TaxID=2787097 RepID=UPI001899EE1A|nr:23S rRNA (guanosine(2251)-2'-O)-methyltransferase RlmB [Eubacterium sp. 1001713B170207_170306_E7]